MDPMDPLDLMSRLNPTNPSGQMDLLGLFLMALFDPLSR
jgi:hypothetical protein